MKQSKYTGKITARYLLLIFLQISCQLHCKCYMVTQLTKTQKSFFARRLRGSIKQQKKIIHYWILMLRLFFYSPKPRTQVWILKKLTSSGRKHRVQQVDMAGHSLLLRRFVFRMEEASAKRVTGDEPQGTMERVQTARPLSPSRLPLRARFKERRLGTRQGWAGARGTGHTTEPRFRPQSHSASRPCDQKKRRGLGTRMRSLLVSVVCASLLNFYL